MEKVVSFAKLEKELRDFANGVADSEMKKTAISVSHNLIEQTPVDTSKALSNWETTIGTPSTKEGEAFFVGKFGSTAKPSTFVSSATNELFIKTAKRRKGQKYFITNNLDYIKGLDLGINSVKNPNFVEKAIKLALAEID